MTQLSTIKDNSTEIMKSAERLTCKLNEPPKKEWLKKTPDGNAEYIPIGILERELRQDFSGLVQFELLSERRELNEYVVTARIKVFHPVILQWLSYDGIGSLVIMQDKNAQLETFNSTKKKNALVLGAANAYGRAIKNAAKKIGEKYGAMLNREEEDSYEPINTLADVMLEVLPLLKAAQTLDDLMLLWESYPDLHTSNRFKFEFGKAKSALTKK